MAVTQDEYGQPVQTESERFERWATVDRKGGNVYNNSGAIEWIYDITIRTKWYKSNPVLITDLVEYEGAQYKVMMITQDNEALKFNQILKCKAIE